MSVTKVVLAKDPWTGSDNSVSEPWFIYTDSQNDTIPIILDQAPNYTDAATGRSFPRVFSVHPDNGNFKVMDGGISFNRSKRGDDATNQGIWVANVTFTKQGTNFDFTTQPDLDRLLSFEVQTRTYTRVAQNAYEAIKPDGSLVQSTPEGSKNLKITNSAGDSFDPSNMQEEYYHPVLAFTQRERVNFDNVAAVAFQGSINSDDITILGHIIPSGKALMRKIAPFLAVNEENEQEWRCRYEVELVEDFSSILGLLDNDDFWLKILDQGFQAKFGDNDAKRRIRESDLKDSEISAGSPDDDFISEEALLDGEGKIDTSDTPVGNFFKYRTKPYKDWEKGLDMISKAIRLR